ncbi:MAG TPA: prolipoprotein diacylglyceryl transferase family protein [Candidatus Binatia bacterium]|nr:prolipoprotein diacylglyceryl transferase family protein [Candidatus Binatia bacterium]
MTLQPYSWLMLAGIGVTLAFWIRVAGRDRRLLSIYLWGLVGALIGAKIIYFVAEGWMVLDRPDKWLRLATGKSIVGALLGGYAAVELAKKVLRYNKVTGDWFATITPIGIILGRIGCWLHGCCLGRPCEATWFSMNDAEGTPRWPAAPVELFFNVIMLALFLIWRRKNKFPGQHFHIYMITYGAFRFLHEFLRDSPRWFGPISGYHIAALLVCALGIIRFYQRRTSISSKDACSDEKHRYNPAHA